jgi:hypothetical protein
MHARGDLGKLQEKLRETLKYKYPSSYLPAVRITLLSYTTGEYHIRFGIPHELRRKGRKANAFRR